MSHGVGVYLIMAAGTGGEVSAGTGFPRGIGGRPGCTGTTVMTIWDGLH